MTATSTSAIRMVSFVVRCESVKRAFPAVRQVSRWILATVCRVQSTFQKTNTHVVRDASRARHVQRSWRCHLLYASGRATGIVMSFGDSVSHTYRISEQGHSRFFTCSPRMWLAVQVALPFYLRGGRATCTVMDLRFSVGLSKPRVKVFNKDYDGKVFPGCWQKRPTRRMSLLSVVRGSSPQVHVNLAEVSVATLCFPVFFWDGETCAWPRTNISPQFLRVPRVSANCLGIAFLPAGMSTSLTFVVVP